MMNQKTTTIGIRREDKHEWERRVPLTPEQVGNLVSQGIAVQVQPSSLRAFADDDYRGVGAHVDEDLSSCGIVLGVKEMPSEFFDAQDPDTLYAFFSHTIKGQPANMPMLRRLMERRAHLVDYERIVDEKGRRLVMFGRYAGLAGMIDALWTLGQRLAVEGHDTPLGKMEPAHRYPDLKAAMSALSAIVSEIASKGWPAEVGPIICGFAGYGNVSSGAQEVFAQLRPVELSPDQLLSPSDLGNRPFYKVVFREEHLVEPVEMNARFDLQDYYLRPEGYRSVFRQYLPHLSVLVNAIYWDERYPRLIRRDSLADDWPELRNHLRVVADISCDVEGSIECTAKATDPGNPVYVYEPLTRRVLDGFEGDGPVILAVDTLPCELPRESSEAFGEMLMASVRELAHVDLKAKWSDAQLPTPLRRATILWSGELTEDYRYLGTHLG
jgi:alpha-aminoadipic semialdehyde synthase